MSDPIDRYSAQRLSDAVRRSVLVLDIRWPHEYLLGNWYVDLLNDQPGSGLLR